MKTTQTRELDRMRVREEAFNLRTSGARKAEYNALFDPNMRHFFENKGVQDHLFKSGLIDHHGRVINLDKNKSKILILEREFREAQKVEERRMKEEAEMRYRIQKKRFDDLEDMRRREMLQKVKADREIGKQIVSILRSSSTLLHGNSISESGQTRKSKSRGSRRTDQNETESNVSFFVTEPTEPSTDAV